MPEESKYTTDTFLDHPLFNQFTDPYKLQGAKAVMEVLEELDFLRYDIVNNCIIFEVVMPGPNNRREYAMTKRVSEQVFGRLLHEKLK